MNSVLVCLGCHRKYHRLDGRSARNLFSHSWKSKIECHQGKFLVMAPFLSYRHPKVSQYPRSCMTFPLYIQEALLDPNHHLFNPSSLLSLYALSKNIIALGVRASTHEFFRDRFWFEATLQKIISNYNHGKEKRKLQTYEALRPLPLSYQPVVLSVKHIKWEKYSNILYFAYYMTFKTNHILII